MKMNFGYETNELLFDLWENNVFSLIIPIELGH